MRLAIGSDHGGFHLKATLVDHLRAAGHEVTDLGTHSTESTDYPDYGHAVARAVAAGEYERGVLICGTGQGISMAANKIPGIRAGVVSDCFSAKMIAAHNNAQIIALGERVVGPGLACELVDAYLATEFEGGRHARRVDKIEP